MRCLTSRRTTGVVAVLGAMAGAARTAGAQWTAQQSETTADFRGLSVVSDRVVWASGSKGIVVHTANGGATWRADTIAGAGALDFRDVKAFDANTAYVMSAGPADSSRIYKTEDGGTHWALQFTNDAPKGFFDAMAFWDRDHGLAVSDPVDGRFLVISTTDGGRHWSRVPPASLPPAIANEGAFAASGTCLVAVAPQHAWFATGGAATSRVFHTADGGRSWSVTTVPVTAAKASRGIFSLAFADARTGFAIGGDYQAPALADANSAMTSDGGRTWTPTAGRPNGYRSGAAVVPGTSGRSLVAVGTTGTDYTRDGGAMWTHVDATEYNSVAFASPSAGWAAGPKGRIAKWSGAALATTPHE